ncbi:hypothetical protein ANCDUO_23247 [Ancylostoma duodenale]|uniref:Uncharacterized protein n=1 Tax=Ancylostoma duodenale TaxID=51022 RepID=A0A0C2CA34_9BILA|nr:hypothetical protein ANCDUO_23247 [Ancylostoma duodenale]
MLFYWQDAGRYLAVFMERGFVNVQVTMGSDTAILRRVKTICRCEFPTPLLANFVLKHRRMLQRQNNIYEWGMVANASLLPFISEQIRACAVWKACETVIACRLSTAIH